jgi:hypothetical protein
MRLSYVGNGIQLSPKLGDHHWMVQTLSAVDTLATNTS